MDERKHEQLRDDISAWVIGALEPAESAALEEHIRGCESCARQVRWLQPATAALLESVEPMEPPPQLRERVMSEVRADAARHEKSRGRERGSFWDFLLRPATALAAVGLIAVGIGGYLVIDDGEQAPDSPPVEAPTPILGSLERQGDTGTLELAGLRQLEDGRVYQAWVQHGDVMRDSSLFVPRADGTATAAIPRDDLHGGEAVLVTIEPRGGSEQPTTEPLVSVKVD